MGQMTTAATVKELYDSVYSRRLSRPLLFATDRYSDFDIGSTLGSISHISRKDSDRHIQIVKRSLDRTSQACRSILDVGCGTGGYLRFISTAVSAPAIGIDISPMAIDIAKNCSKSDINVRFLASDAEKIPLADSTAGAALAIDTLHLVNERRRALKEIRRVLTLQGTLVFTVMHTGGDVGRVISDWVKDVESAGYVVANLRDLSEAWRGHMLAKHAWRWARRQRLRRILGSWIEPDLKVSSAMLGIDGTLSVVVNTVRFEFIVQKY